jgi:hypothetical protein
MKRKGLTPEGREKLRQSALLHQPWLFSTGPRTPAGKARAALNGKHRQLGIRSVREIKADLAEVRSLLREMRDGRALVGGTHFRMTSERVGQAGALASEYGMPKGDTCGTSICGRTTARGPSCSRAGDSRE